MKCFVVRPVAPLALLVALALPACSGNGTLDPDETVFLAHKTPHANVMDALYDGRVTRDAQGCLRTDDSSGAVVIWPHGFNLRARAGGLYVENAEGRAIGRIGDGFRMGGGQAPAGNAGTYLSAADLARAAACPTDVYWIVGGIS